MPRFRIENLREEDDKSEHTWWEKAQERFWEWWIYGRPSSKIRIKKLKLKSYRVPALYIGFVKGEITKEDLYDRLRPTQVGEFIALHELVKQGLETGKADIPPELAIALAESFMDRRR
ncbi:hypothetical protein, partial [Pedobacter sp.]|uniref:hypothetical protein n=1 Tax=Pedobacter sp. TaxID=1411316 RepID=UPI002B68C531